MELSQCPKCGTLFNIETAEYRNGDQYCSVCTKKIPKSRIQKYLDKNTGYELSKLYPDFLVHFDEMITSGKKSTAEGGFSGSMDTEFKELEDKAIECLEIIKKIFDKGKKQMESKEA